MLNKQTIRMEISDLRDHDVEFTDKELYRGIDLPLQDWIDMGSPEKIIVTIQPADLYDEERRKIQEVLEKARAQSKRTDEVLAKTQATRDRVEPVLRRAGLIK